MRVLAIDPSLRGTGYAVLEKTGNKVVARTYGVIKNPDKLLPSGCLIAIHSKLAEVIEQHAPECAAIEGVIFVQNYRTAIIMGSARGAAMVAIAQRGLPIYEYAPRKVKQAVVGRGGAVKAQVAFMVRALLGLTETPPPDAADAIAIGLTHMRSSESARAGALTIQQI